MAIETAVEARQFVIDYVKLLKKLDEVTNYGKMTEEEAKKTENSIAGEIALMFFQVDQHDKSEIDDVDLVSFCEQRRDMYNNISAGFARRDFFKEIVK